MDLLFEASLGLVRVGIAQEGRIVAQRQAVAKAEEMAQWVPELIQELGISLEEIRRIGATTGPGSFTGIRTALAYASGLCARKTRTLHLCTTFQAVAWSASGLDACAEPRDAYQMSPMRIVLFAHGEAAYVATLIDGEWTQKMRTWEQIAAEEALDVCITDPQSLEYLKVHSPREILWQDLDILSGMASYLESQPKDWQLWQSPEAIPVNYLQASNAERARAQQ